MVPRGRSLTIAKPPHQRSIVTDYQNPDLVGAGVESNFASRSSATAKLQDLAVCLKLQPGVMGSCFLPIFTEIQTVFTYFSNNVFHLGFPAF